MKENILRKEYINLDLAQQIYKNITTLESKENIMQKIMNDRL